MKTIHSAALVLASIVLVSGGCGKKETLTPPATSTPVAAAPAAPAATPEKSTMATAIDGFTGKTSVDAGMRAKAQIKAASEKEKRDRDEALQQ